MKPVMLPQAFFNRDTVTVARELLGKYLVRREGDLVLAGRITETEAYIGRMDKACHAYNYRRTARTETLFAPPGTAYVYLIYGMYCCLNLVTELEGEPAAVLIRGLEPRMGMEQMAQNRYARPAETLTKTQRRNFLNGPGKLCKAMNITRACNGLPWGSPELAVYDGLPEGFPVPPEDAKPLEIHVGTRIGVDYAGEDAKLPWRFWLSGERK